MSNINDAFPSKYLKASDLKGQQPVVTIRQVEMELVGRNKERKLVMYFKDKEKGMVLNKTNANKIMSIVGSALTEDWTNHQIRLYPSVTTFQGEEVECVRVKAIGAERITLSKPVTPSPPPDPPQEFIDEDPIPF